MRLKLDENLGASIAEHLRTKHHDVSTVPEENLCGVDDTSVFNAASSERRILVTLDLDFSSPIRFPPTQDSGVIVIRLNRPTHSLIVEALDGALPHITDPEGAIWIAEIGRIRVHRPEGES